MSKLSVRVFLFLVLVLVAVPRFGILSEHGIRPFPCRIYRRKSWPIPKPSSSGGKILTVDDQFSMVQALAIRGERILAVGDDARILKMAGPDTETIDLQGKTVIPGMIDTHYHLGDYVLRHMLLEEKGIQWEGTVEKLGILWKDADQALRDIKQAVEAASPWRTGEGPQPECRYSERCLHQSAGCHLAGQSGADCLRLSAATSRSQYRGHRMGQNSRRDTRPAH